MELRHDFFLAQAGAAVILTGLVFVGASVVRVALGQIASLPMAAAGIAVLAGW